MAAALHNKLDSIAKTLQNWPMVPPVVPLLDKAECYFNKVETKFSLKTSQNVVENSHDS